MEEEVKCDSLDGVVIWYGLSLVAVSAMIAFVFSFFQKRRNLKPSCCYGAPALFPPLDFLTGQPSRLLLVLALASLSGHVIQNILLRPVLLSNLNETAIQIITVLIRIAWFVYAAFLFLPTLIFSMTKVPIVGYVIGIMHTILLIGYFILYGYTLQRGCLYFDIQLDIEPPELVSVLVGIVPIFICLLVILVWYIFFACKEIVLKCKGKKGWVQPYSTLHINSYNYTKTLLSRNLQSNVPPSNLLKKILDKIYTNQPGFKYPLRLVIALSGAFIVLYELSFLIIPRFLNFGTSLFDISNGLANTTCENVTSNVTQILCNVLDHRETIVNGITYYLIAGPFVAFPFTLLHFIPIMKNVRTHMLQSYSGKLVAENIKLTPSFIISSSIKYPGYQIGYLTLGWFIYALVVWLLGIIVIIVVLVFVYAYATFLVLLASVIATISVNILIHVLQIVLSKRVFAEEHEPPLINDVVMTNRRYYLAVSYFLYCYNGMLGIASSFGRTTVATVQGLIYAPRLDISLLKNPKHDKGYMVYLGFIQLEAVQNNPIVHVFVDLLMEKVKNKTAVGDQSLSVSLTQVVTVNNGELEEHGIEEIGDSFDQRSTRASTRATINSASVYHVFGDNWPRVSMKAYNHWHLAIFLLRNPSLVTYRRCYKEDF